MSEVPSQLGSTFSKRRKWVLDPLFAFSECRKWILDPRFAFSKRRKWVLDPRFAFSERRKWVLDPRFAFSERLKWVLDPLFAFSERLKWVLDPRFAFPTHGNVFQDPPKANTQIRKRAQNCEKSCRSFLGMFQKLSRVAFCKLKNELLAYCAPVTP